MFSYSASFDEDVIYSGFSSIFYGSWSEEVQCMNVEEEKTLEGTQQSNLILTTLPLLVNDSCVTNLSRLDTLEIGESSEKQASAQLANIVKEQTVQVNRNVWFPTTMTRKILISMLRNLIKNFRKRKYLV